MAAPLLLVLAYPHYIPILFWTPEMAYGQIKDLSHPTANDYLLVQKVLCKGKRPGLARLKDTEAGCRKLRIIGKSPEQQPQSRLVAVNCAEGDRENCVIVYASLNKNFPGGAKRLASHIEASDYRGHLFYRIGGWPNIEEGDLALAHVPYAFKVSFFREAKRLGFKRVLWLDASILPIVSLNEIFSQIEKRGYFVMGNSYPVGPFFNEEAAKALGVTLEESFQIPICSAGLFGLDFSYEAAREALDAWTRAARDGAAFFSPRSDQSALSVILYKLGMRDFAPIATLAHGEKNIAPESLFLIDREFVRK